MLIYIGGRTKSRSGYYLSVGEQMQSDTSPLVPVSYLLTSQSRGRETSISTASLFKEILWCQDLFRELRKGLSVNPSPLKLSYQSRVYLLKLLINASETNGSQAYYFF